MIIFILGIVLGQYEKDMLRLTNEFRRENNLKELELYYPLEKTARMQAEFMCSIMKITHDGPEKKTRTLDRRLLLNDFVGENIGENIAKQQGDNYGEVFRIWKRSDKHKKNILGDYTYTGIYTCKDRRKNRYWVQVFGKPASGKKSSKETNDRDSDSSKKESKNDENIKSRIDNNDVTSKKGGTENKAKVDNKDGENKQVKNLEGKNDGKNKEEKNTESKNGVNNQEGKDKGKNDKESKIDESNNKDDKKDKKKDENKGNENENDKDKDKGNDTRNKKKNDNKANKSEKDDKHEDKGKKEEKDNKEPKNDKNNGNNKSDDEKKDIKETENGSDNKKDKDKNKEKPQVDIQSLLKDEINKIKAEIITELKMQKQENKSNEKPEDSKIDLQELKRLLSENPKILNKSNEEPSDTLKTPQQDNNTSKMALSDDIGSSKTNSDTKVLENKKFISDQQKLDTIPNIEILKHNESVKNDKEKPDLNKPVNKVSENPKSEILKNDKEKFDPNKPENKPADISKNVISEEKQKQPTKENEQKNPPSNPDQNKENPKNPPQESLLARFGNTENNKNTSTNAEKISKPKIPDEFPSKKDSKPSTNTITKEKD
ncbi:hypothetical protein CWI36_0755p0020, partial [Hamiltosporidium magnivora]